MAEAARIARAFDAAAAYDAHAVVQRQVADWLAERIVAVAPPAPRVLEVGCGTGFLTGATLPRLVCPDWLMTDIAPAMLARGMAAHPAVRGRVMDGEFPDLPGESPFDLIVSSLAVQWFGDLDAGLRRLAGWLAPGGRMLVTTLVRGTFAAWHEAHRAEGFVAGSPVYPPVEALGWPVETRSFVQRHDSAADFMRALRAIGAGTPRDGHRPIPPGAMRRIAKRFEAGGAVATYEVALIDLPNPRSA
ncbi:methyltransferase domain-containing protein [Sphingomonas sanguinis]|uniref:methyltransferase n=1 Tax=Sphingomonas sanguinis TaxID=33051 RepID=UPI001C569B04|nr:methyltransferase [Sphingomonas sanguinis]QXT34548.1 methyltransferase domain-containing protein [Sphingomonas sanguinis]